MTARRRPSARKRGASWDPYLRFWGCEKCGRSNEIVVALDGSVKSERCADLTRLRSLNRHGPSRRGGRSAALILALVGVGLAGVARGQVVTEFPIPTASSFPYGIAAGPDGNLWFTEISGRQQDRPDHHGRRRHRVPHPHGRQQPSGHRRRPGRQPLVHRINANQIGRITTAGVDHGVPRSHAGQRTVPVIAAGPDGNLWFTENAANKIGRITTAGVVTEFPIPTASQLALTGSRPARTATSGSPKSAASPTRSAGSRRPASSPSSPSQRPSATLKASRRARTATSGSPNTTPTRSGGSRPPASSPSSPSPLPAAAPTGSRPARTATSGSPSEAGNQIGRITPAGVDHRVPRSHGRQPPCRHHGRPGRQPLVHRERGNQIGRITTGPLDAAADGRRRARVAGDSSNANGVLEPGETVQVAPAWKNTLTSSQTFTGTASNLTGPAGPTYTIDDSSADYGTVAARRDPGLQHRDRRLLPDDRLRHTPVQHWDATFSEGLSAGSITKTWTLHVGDSFPDVPTSNQFYAFIENLFHNGITGGCAGGDYCPDNSVTRAQMAVFLLKSKLGAAVPPPATGTVFADVPASNPFAPWIEQLAGFADHRRLRRRQLLPEQPGHPGPDGGLPAEGRARLDVRARRRAAGVFADVDLPVPIRQLDRAASRTRDITGGCGGGNYCPNNPNTRGQMAVFLVKTFGLQLYGP